MGSGPSHEPLKKAGAKYFFSMGEHHYDFDLWSAKYTRWIAVTRVARSLFTTSPGATEGIGTTSEIGTTLKVDPA